MTHLNLKFFITDPQTQINVQKTLFEFGYKYAENSDEIKLNIPELYVIAFDDGTMIASEDLEEDYDLTYAHHKECDLRSLVVMEGRRNGLGQDLVDITKVAINQSLKDAKHLWLLLGVFMDNKSQMHQTVDYHQAIEIQMVLCDMSKKMQKILDRID